MRKLNNKVLFSAVLLFTSQGTMLASGWFETLLNILFNTPSKPKPQLEHHYYPSGPTYSSSSSYNDSYNLTESQARNYIDQSIASLDFALRPHIKDSEHLRYLKNLITDNIYNARHVYKYTSYGKRYKKDAIDQFIGSAVLQYIEEKSYSYAYHKTSNRTVAKKISESMRNNALAIIDKSGTVNFESLKKFVGDSLIRAVNEAINRFDAPYQVDYDNNNSSYAPKPSAPPYNPEIYEVEKPKPSAPSLEEKLYPSEDCCVCYESFDNVQRLFLKPCGHDICKTCAFSWFWDNKKKTCPQCRATVNFDQLSQDIA